MRIMYIDIDTLRPSNLSCYGYSRPTSPAIDAIAAEGLRCENVFCSDAPCLPSRTAFYSGRFGIQTGVVGHGGSTADPKIEGKLRGFVNMFEAQGLAHQFQRLGLHTAMVSPFGQRHSAFQFYAGFKEIHNTGHGGMESAEEVMPTVANWLRQHAREDNWYFHFNLWDPHTPYRAPASFGDPFKDHPLPAWITDEVIARHMKMTGPHTAQDISMYHDREDAKYPRHPGRITDQKSLRRMIDGYDTGVRYADQQVALAVQMLKEAGVYDDTAIIISSDHAENMGELGIYGEHGTADVATCRIPMIIKWPGGVRGQVDKSFHYNLDWAPTVMDLLGQKPCEIWDGRSYAATVRSGAAAGREELILSQCCHVCQRSVRFGPWLYMRTYHDGFHLFPQEMLYNLETDPNEQNNVAERHPEVCREGAWRLLRWHDAQMDKMPQDKIDPLWTVMSEGGPMHAIHEKGRGPLAKYIERLRQTGRADGAAALEKKYAKHLA